MILSAWVFAPSGPPRRWQASGSTWMEQQKILHKGFFAAMLQAFAHSSVVFKLLKNLHHTENTSQLQKQKLTSTHGQGGGCTPRLRVLTCLATCEALFTVTSSKKAHLVLLPHMSHEYPTKQTLFIGSSAGFEKFFDKLTKL